MPAGEMESEYSVGVNNRFIGIESDMIDDPLELIRAAQEKPKKDRDVKTKGKKDVKPAKGTKEKTVKIESTPVTDHSEGKRSEGSDRPRGRGRGRGRGGDRGGRGRGGRGGFSAGSPRDESGGGFGDGNSGGGSRGGPRGACHRCGEEGHFVRNCPQQANSPAAASSEGGFGAPSSGGFGAPSSGGFGAPSSGGFGAPSSGGFGGDDDDRRGGRGGFRGGRGGRGRGRGGRGGREFDRRSGSDKSSVKAVDKRDGSGSYNWGTPEDELAASEEQTQTGGFGTPKDTDDNNVPTIDENEEPENGSGEEESKENVEANQMSLAEYKEKMEQSRPKTQFNLRKANEGEKIKGVKELKKPTEEDNEKDGSLFFPKKYYEEKVKTSGRVKEHMNLEFQYNTGDNRHMDTERGRRGGRGRGRGGRGNRKDEGGYGGGFGSSSNQIQLESTDEFPTLN